MIQTPYVVTLSIALITTFLIAATAIKYGMEKSTFARNRAIMTLFVFFVTMTLGVSFWHNIMSAITYIIVSLVVGVLIGYFVGVETAKKKLTMQGLEYYTEHFAHIHIHDFKKLTWWSVINFYSVIIALFMINLIGLATVIFKTEIWAVISLSAGAFLLGTLLPYILHLWSLTASTQKGK